MSTTHALVALANTCATTWTATLPSAPALVYTAAKPRGPMLENIKHAEVATPTVKRGFVSSKFWGLVRLHWFRMVSGGMGLPARLAARLRACFQHPVHPLRLKTRTVVSLIHAGTKTMTHVTQGRTAPVLATSATTHHTTEERRAFAALEAANCAALARWYSARGNVKAARRKAVQLLAALAVLEGVQHV